MIYLHLLRILGYIGIILPLYLTYNLITMNDFSKMPLTPGPILELITIFILFTTIFATGILIVYNTWRGR
jgi:hypothetical protein